MKGITAALSGVKVRDFTHVTKLGNSYGDVYRYMDYTMMAMYADEGVTDWYLRRSGTRDVFLGTSFSSDDEEKIWLCSV